MIVPDRKRRLLCVALAAAALLAPAVGMASPPPGVSNTDADGQNGGVVTLRNLVPSEWLEAQGARAYQGTLDTARANKRLLPGTNTQAKQIRETLQKLIPYASKWNDRAKTWNWQVNVIRDSEINAFCLPGGKLLITTGTLDRLKLNENETAFLMGHLIAHALREHARARIGQQQLSELSSKKIPELFDANGIERLGVDVGPALLAMRYGADDETEADVIGADISSRAGYDPRAGLVLWQKIDWIARRRETAFTLAHPINPKRLADLKKRQKDMLPLYAKAIGKSVGALPPYRSGTGRYKM